MSTQTQNYVALPRLAIGLGDTTPNPGKVGAQAWSTTLLDVVLWNGSTWQLCGSSSPGVSFYDRELGSGYNLAYYDVGRGVKIDNSEGAGNEVICANLSPGAGIDISGTNQLTITNLKPGPQSLSLSAFQSTTVTTATVVSGLSFTVASGVRYRFKYSICFTTGATTTGITLSVNGPTTSNLIYVGRIWTNGNGAAAPAQYSFRTWASAMTTSSIDATLNECFADIEGVFVPSATGTLSLRWSTGTAGVTARMQAGTCGQLWTT
jgi:hypothetical protein